MVQTVFIVAANRFFRESLSWLFGKEENLSVLGAEDFSARTLQEIVRLDPDLVVVTPDWHDVDFQATRAIHAAVPRAKILMISMMDDEYVFLRAVRAGALGYLLKDAPAEEIVMTVRHLAANSVVCPRHLEHALFDYIAGGAPSRGGLTLRERQLIALISEGLTNKEIASRLHLSEQTVKNHVHRILRKTGTSNRTSLSQMVQLQPDSESAGEPQSTSIS
ncbi:MAG: response regulator transcription factor [Acidobacteriota bacterium]|nr:response regulator transcription factor [Acidobacteriota bacterium]